MNAYMPERVVFLLSGWYSGATLLTMLLDRHPAVVSNGEAFPFDNHYQGFTCTCGAKLFDCEFYRYAANHMLLADKYDPRLFIRSPIFDLPRPLQRFAQSPRFTGPWRHCSLNLLKSYRNHVGDFCGAHALFMQRALSYFGGNVYLDGTKSLRRAELLTRNLDVPIHFWLLVKDCRGFCASMLRSRQWPLERVTDAAREWVEYIRHARRLARIFPEARFRTIRYEDLCREPDQLLEELLKEIGVDTIKKNEKFSWQPHLLGNDMRKTFNGRVEARRPWWKDVFDEQIEQKIIEIARIEMRKFFYI